MSDNCIRNATLSYITAFAATLGAEMSLPLNGMKVLDLSRALSGPFCSMILGDLGADVIKVEPLPDGDLIRSWGPFEQSESVYYLSTNRNKRGICVNFRSAEGRKLLRELALGSDVLIENFKPGTLAEMGLAADDLNKQRPELIVASISAFGRGGPLGGRPGFDQIAQGYAGFMSFTGTEESGPTRVGVAIGDLTSGMWLAIGILATWSARLQSGLGTTVETSLLASLVGLLSVQGQRYLSLGEVASPTGNVHPVIAPYGVFRAKDGTMNIGAATQGMWLKFCDIIGSPELKADSRFLNNAARMTHRESLREIIEAKLANGTREEWTTRMVEAGIPAGPLNNIADVFSDEQVKHCELVQTIDHPVLGALRQVATPIALGGSMSDRLRRAPPLIGQHTREALSERGFDAARIADLEQTGVIYQAECAPGRATESPAEPESLEKSL